MVSREKKLEVKKKLQPFEPFCFHFYVELRWFRSRVREGHAGYAASKSSSSSRSSFPPHLGTDGVVTEMLVLQVKVEKLVASRDRARAFGM